MPSVLARLDRFDIDPVIRSTAAAYPDPALRSLDAIHSGHCSSRRIDSTIDRAGYLRRSPQ